MRKNDDDDREGKNVRKVNVATCKTDFCVGHGNTNIRPKDRLFGTFKGKNNLRANGEQSL